MIGSDAGNPIPMATRKQTPNELDAAERNAMSDTTFAFPRVRKEPLNDARHVRNAIARFDQVRDVSDQERAEAFRRIKRAAAKYGVEMTETRWQDLGKPSAGRKSSDKERSKKQLYSEAQKRDIPGRSTMSKAELVHALESR
jgi:acyl-CoA reductase-like NAD-dependent aldehyde dehydrogenase